MIVYCVIAFVLGIIIALIVTRNKPCGVLKVYIPDYPEEPPYLYVELSKSISEISKEKNVKFKVDMTNINSQN